MFVDNTGNNLFRVRENEKGMWVKDEMALTMRMEFLNETNVLSSVNVM
jgi:hypothetical protein